MEEEIIDIVEEVDYDSIEDYSSDIESTFNFVFENPYTLTGSETIGEYYYCKGSDITDIERPSRYVKRLPVGTTAYKIIKNSKVVLFRIYDKSGSDRYCKAYTISGIGKRPKYIVDFGLSHECDSNLPIYKIDNLIGDKIVENISKSQSAYDRIKADCNKQYKKYLDLFDTSFADNLAIVKDLCEFYHDDDWSFDKVNTIANNGGQLHENVSYDKAIYVLTIKFPDITIKNSKSKSNGLYHEIKDLYVTAYFDKDMKLLRGLYGRRMSITSAEYHAKYAHSHLPRNKSNYYQTFCLGQSGNPIKDVVDDMCFVKLNPYLFEKFLLHLASMVRYESLEGTPHIKFEEVKPSQKSVYRPNQTTINAELEIVINNIREPLPLMFNNDSLSPVKVDDTNVKFFNYLDTLSTENLKCIVDNGIGYRLSGDAQDNSGLVKLINSYPKLYFRDKLISPKLIEEESVENYVEGMEPNAKKELYNALTKRANDILLNKHTYESRSR